MEKEGTQRHLRVVLVAAPFQGHMSPMLQLAALLHSKGFSIIFVHTKSKSPDTEKHPEFFFLSMPDYESSSFDPFTFISNLNKDYKEPLQKQLSQMMEKQGLHDQIACIIYDSIMYFSEAVAKGLKLPSIILRTSCVLNLLGYRGILRLQAQGHNPIQGAMSEDLVPGLHPLRFKDLPIPVCPKQEDTLELVSLLSNLRTSSAIIFNTVDYLEHSALSELKKNNHVEIFPVGPLHKVVPASTHSFLKEDASCIQWLDKQASNSVIYVSLGSVATMDEKELTEMAWGLANSNQQFLWVIRPGSILGSEWVEHLPESFNEIIGERGCIVKWAPQKEVLAHDAVGGFLSHCGWNSTMESICEGVPIICRPCFIDQKVNARYLNYVWKIGLELEHPLGRGEIERAVRRLMVDKEGEEMRQRAIDMKEKIEFCVQKGCSSYNSLEDLVDFICSF